MAKADGISQGDKLPEQGEFFDAVRRHICQVLGFDCGFVDIVRGHEVENFIAFMAEEVVGEGEEDILALLEDDEKQPLLVAHTMLAQKVKQTQKPWVGRAYLKDGPEEGYPYVILPILESGSEGPGSVRGLLRVVSLDDAREVDDKTVSTLRLFAQHLSLRLTDIANSLEKPQEKPPEPAPLDKEHVLVIHTNRSVRRRLVKILMTKHEVTEGDSSSRALEILKGSAIDLVVLDSEVRGSSGMGFCQVLKQHPQFKHTPVILITKENDVAGKVDGLNAGAEDCLSETCHEAELLARVRASLRLRKTERDLAMQSQLLEDYAQRLECAVESEREASIKVTKENRGLADLNRELEEKKLREQVLLGQEQLLRRISDIIRHSFNVDENISKMLEELAGHFSLDCCFVILPSPEEPQDAVRQEYAGQDEFKVIEQNIDLAILETFQANCQVSQPLVLSDVARERASEPFRRDALRAYQVLSLFYVPITYGETFLGLLGGHRCESEIQWTSENKNFLRSVAGQIAIGVTNARLYARVQRQATTDGLTGLVNHRTGQEKLTEQLRLAERYQRNVAVIMIDVDHFKSINDTFGHPDGDTVLRSVARQIRDDCRDVDIPVRYGGEEFLLVLPEVNQEGAVVLAERIRRNLARQPIEHDGIEIQVTASLGVAAFPEDAQTQQQLLDLADKALYMSKRLGRNQVHTAGDLVFADVSAPAPEPPPGAPSAPAGAPSSAPAPGPKIEPARPEPAEKEELGAEVVEMVKALATALYSKSDYHKAHHLETARFAELLAKVMGLTGPQVEQIRVASLLHDVGILSIPEAIVNKPGLITQEEMEVITQHPSLGAQMLRPIKALKEICDIVENHHECWDGTGYPRGLKGEEIPLPARILSIVDAYHAMISDRPYRPAMSKVQAKNALKNGAGTQWDPFLVDIFLAVLDSMEQEAAQTRS